MAIYQNTKNINYSDNYITSVAIEKNDKYFAVGGNLNQIQIFATDFFYLNYQREIETPKMITTFDTSNHVLSLSFDPNYSHLLATSEKNGLFFLFLCFFILLFSN